jgi:uncharacterized protein
MRIPSCSVTHGVPALTAALAFIAALLWSACALAQVRLYEVSVPLQGTTEADRATAMAEALKAVAVRASGRREAADHPAISGASPSKYLQRYSTTADRKLKVGFDGRSIEQLLQQAGLPLWPAERPLTLVTAPVTDPTVVEAAAEWRGLPIVWSTGEVTATSSGARATLTGVPSGAEFAWTFSHDGRTAEARGSAQAGIHLAADTLAARYAPASTRSSSSLSLRIGGMDDLADYAGLLEYLRSLSLVRDVEVESLDGAVVRLRMVVRGDRELLGRIAALDGRLQPGAAADAGAEPAVDFVYQP